jgi:type IV conjugative transfer system lipoprotein TraV
MNKSFRSYQTLVLLAAALTVSGCTTLGLGEANDFSCANIPEEATCLPAHELYELTENTDDIQQAIKDRDTSKAQSISYTQNAYREPRKVMPTFDQPLGIMRPPEVTRVWVAPWVDEEGALHMPGYVFLTTDPGGWEFESGTNQIMQPNLYPLEVDSESDSAGGAGFYNDAQASQSPLDGILPFNASALE